MPNRDYKKYIYPPIRIERDSETYKALIKDAERTGSKQLGMLLSVRVEEYYKLKVAGLLEPGHLYRQSQQIVQMVQEPQPIANGTSNHVADPDANAEAALNEW